MYSTLIVLDKPRHLRYTFGAVNDLEQAIPGGFLNLFKLSGSGENGFRILRDILYTGLKWEDPTLTIQDIGSTMIYLFGNNVSELLVLWKLVFDALDYDEWTSTNRKTESTGKTIDTIRELLDEVEKVAYGSLNMHPDELYAITPRELNLKMERFGELENHRVGLICATIMNSQGGKKGGEPFKVSDFINVKKEPEIMSDDQISKTLRNAFGV